MRAADVVDAIEKFVLESDSPRDAAIYLVGVTMGLALRAGWTFDELAKAAHLVTKER